MLLPRNAFIETKLWGSSSRGPHKELENRNSEAMLSNTSFCFFLRKGWLFQFSTPINNFHTTSSANHFPQALTFRTQEHLPLCRKGNMKFVHHSFLPHRSKSLIMRTWVVHRSMTRVFESGCIVPICFSPWFISHLFNHRYAKHCKLIYFHVVSLFI